jgi:hypothetical protein
VSSLLDSSGSVGFCISLAMSRTKSLTSMQRLFLPSTSLKNEAPERQVAGEYMWIFSI